MKHQKKNSTKQHERKFDRKGVRQLSQVVTEELTGMHAHLQAQKALIEAIIRVLGIDEKLMEQLKLDAAREDAQAAGDAPAGLLGPESIAAQVDPEAPLSPAAQLEVEAAVRAGLTDAMEMTDLSAARPLTDLGEPAS